MVRGNFKQGGVNVIGLFLFYWVVDVSRGNVNFIFTHSYFILVTSLYFVNIFLIFIGINFKCLFWFHITFVFFFLFNQIIGCFHCFYLLSFDNVRCSFKQGTCIRICKDVLLVNRHIFSEQRDFLLILWEG